MANEQNLRPGGTPGGYELSREEAKKGGIASGKSRGERASLRKAMQGILSGTYTDKSGKEISGADAVCLAMFRIASNSKDKQAVQAFRSIMELTGEARIPAEVDNPGMEKLDEILAGLKENAENAKK